MAFEMLLERTDAMIQDAQRRQGLPEVSYSVEPSRQARVDASSNVAFLMARKVHRSPYVIANMLASECKSDELIQDVSAHKSGYLNVVARWEALAGNILRACKRSGYGGDDLGDNATVTVEHTSVNPNKALHIGHVRNIVIGDVIYRILKKTGHKVRVLNYVDDSGLQVADVVLGFSQLGFDMAPPTGKKFDEYCGDVVYVKVSQMCENDRTLQDARNEILRRIEKGENETAKLAEKITRRVLAAQLETCWRLGVRYDLLNYESHILRSGLWGKVFDIMKKMHLTHLETDGDNAGCWVIDDKVIVRSNGTATYMAKDIPYAAWKLGLIKDPFGYVLYPGQAERDLHQSVLENGQRLDYASDKVITVIDSRQAPLQKAITELMARFKSTKDAYVHLGYEAVTLSPETAKGLGLDTSKKTQMSGRKGLYVSADAVYEKVYDRAVSETASRNPDMDYKTLSDIGDILAVGTIRYEMIRQDLSRPIVFDMVRSTSMEGDTAPYLLYSYVRARRILEKAHTAPDYDSDLGVAYSQREKSLLRLLGLYQTAIGDALKNLAPKVVARYSHELAVAFNGFYESHKVVGSETENARLCMVDAFCTVIQNALDLLGIKVPARM